MNERTRGLRRDWLVALVMLCGGALPGVGLFFLSGGSLWAAVLSGLIFWPCAFVAGCIAVRNEDSRGW